MAAMGGLYLVALLFGVVIGILWIILPFAVFGTKPLLRELISEIRETNALLANMTDRDKALSAAKKRRDVEQPIAY